MKNRRLQEQFAYSNLTIGNIPNFNITGTESHTITWSGASGPGPVYISLIDTSANASLGQIGMVKIDNGSFNWNLNCGMSFPSNGNAQIFVAKMQPGQTAYDPNMILGYGYSNTFTLTNSCGTTLHPTKRNRVPGNRRLREAKNAIQRLLRNYKRRK